MVTKEGGWLDAGASRDYCPPVRSFFSLAVALTLGWSSVVDNPAVCVDDAAGPISTSRPCGDDGVPSAPCASCPCHLPSLRIAVEASVEPHLGIESPQGVWPAQSLHVIEPVAPPTPPPLA